MNEPPGTSDTRSTRAITVVACVAVVASIAVQCWLASIGKQLSVDDHFRVYHVLAFLERPRFAPSAVWLPGYSWVMGAVLAVVRETWWTPRFVGVAMAAMTMFASAGSARAQQARAIAATLVAASPALVLVGPTPLSETMFVLALVVSARALARFRVRGRVSDGVVAVAATAFASSVRYEGWLLLPVVAAFMVCGRSPFRVRRLFWLLPLAAFPVAWLLHVQAREGNALAFLDAVKTDLYGTGDLLSVIRGPGIVPVAFALVSLVGVCVSVRVDRRPSMRVHQAFALTLFASSLLAVIDGDVPSQLPVRLVLAGTVLSAVPLAGLAQGSLRASMLALLAVVGIGAGAVLFVATPDAAPDGARAIGSLLGSELARDRGAHALTYGRFPDIVAVDVASSAIGRVHIEGTRKRCPIRLLTCDSPCATRPEFADAVRYAVLESPLARARAERVGFVAVAEAGRYRLYRRPRSAPPLCAGADAQVPVTPP